VQAERKGAFREGRSEGSAELQSRVDEQEPDVRRPWVDELAWNSKVHIHQDPDRA